ncbi:TRAP transporter substrate-binding protein [Marinobacterium rhizophilum]|uniref:TRAP transporter substrate-binding protein DctP n=1 Tax=Marinobacterium rhizophilum TaxID=420402 RepID=A0ABY5HLC9_9GAMM|nr:TRAP transporter substrate-binding protein DctP [Marinobacterium rhizophilum]UTW12035.1 TRAP transporter substrate-binding protein DctP [Marinobacterium rhizophilum]
MLKSFRTSLLAASAVTLQICATQSSALELKLANVLPESHNWNVAARGFADEVKAQTENRVSIKLFANGQLGSENTLVEGLQIGSIHAGIIGCGSFQPVDPKFGIVELPYSWPNRQAAYAAYDGELGEQLEGLAEAHNFKILSWWENGYRHITNNRAPIHTPEDLQGLKIRVTPDKMRLDAFAGMGASPAPLAFGELYSALQQGVFDAQENPLSIINSSSFYEVQKYVSLTGHVWSPACLTVSNYSWNRLSAEDQQIVQDLADKWRDTQRELTQKDDAELIAKLEAAGMQVNEVDTAPFSAQVQDIWTQYESVFGADLVGLVKRYSSAQ